MASPVLNASRGVGLAVKEAARSAFDRLVPGGAIPLRASGVTPEWLAGAIGVRAGAIRSVRVVDEHSGTAARARVAIEADDDAGLPEHLFVKFMPHNFAQHTMMNLFELGRREVALYRTFGATPPVRIPHCYAAEIDDLRGRNILILEDLTGAATFRTVRDSISATEAEAVVDAMADQHTAFWDKALPPVFGSMSTRTPGAEALSSLIRRRFLGNPKVTSELIPDGVRHSSSILFERAADVENFWESQTQTLIHGDPHLGNLFFEGPTPGFLDWQVAMSCVGVRDVAYFATASVEPDLLRKIERGLVERYVARLGAADIDVTFDHQWARYQAGITAFYTSAVCAAEAGERAQPPEVAMAGVERAVAAVEAHDSFEVLAALVDGNRS